MSYSIRYTPESQRDIEGIWDGVFEVSKDYDTADRYIDELMDTVAGKKAFPLSGTPLRYRGLFTGFYYVKYKKYLVFYRVNDSYIEVIRVIMSKMDYMRILFGD